jgi:hypothetical protein
MNYVLPIIGAYLVINGIVIGGQAATIEQQILSALGVGFGLLVIGLGALIGVVKIGFARLEKRLSSAPEEKQLPPAPKTATSSEQLPPLSEKTSLLDRLAASRPFKTHLFGPDLDVANMTPTEIGETQRLARGWKTKSN